MKQANRVQELLLELMKEASFNDFDGPAIVETLQSHGDLWRAALLDRDGLIKLRDLPEGYWNVDTLWLLAAPGHEDELYALAQTWGADEVDWIAGEEACGMLGSYSRGVANSQKAILRIWWD